MNKMFEGCNELENLNLTNLITSNVENMSLMFSKCYKLKEIAGIDNFNTSKAIYMKSMFKECKELSYLDLSKFNTSNIINMNGMFELCYELKEIKGINNFNTSKVINMGMMFAGCHKLEYLDLTNFNTSNVNIFEKMFNECYELKTIKGINNFNTSKVTNICGMFSGCRKLEILDLPNFARANINIMEGIFYECYKLKEIKAINSFNTSKVTNMSKIFFRMSLIRIFRFV